MLHTNQRSLENFRNLKMWYVANLFVCSVSVAPNTNYSYSIITEEEYKYFLFVFVSLPYYKSHLCKRTTNFG